MFEENIAVSRRLVTEALGEGKVELIDELCAENYVGHDPLTGDQDRDAAKQSIIGYKSAFPDLSFTVDDAFIADDKVVLRWTGNGTFENALMGIEPTGERGEPISGITIDRFEDGLVVESWNQWDTLRFMRNLGAVGAGTATA
jgi:predicted ester cyclase